MANVIRNARKLEPWAFAASNRRVIVFISGDSNTFFGFDGSVGNGGFHMGYTRSFVAEAAFGVWATANKPVTVGFGDASNAYFTRAGDALAPASLHRYGGIVGGGTSEGAGVWVNYAYSAAGNVGHGNDIPTPPNAELGSQVNDFKAVRAGSTTAWRRRARIGQGMGGASAFRMSVYDAGHSLSVGPASYSCSAGTAGTVAEVTYDTIATLNTTAQWYGLYGIPSYATGPYSGAAEEITGPFFALDEVWEPLPGGVPIARGVQVQPVLWHSGGHVDQFVADVGAASAFALSDKINRSLGLVNTATPPIVLHVIGSIGVNEAFDGYSKATFKTNTAAYADIFRDAVLALGVNDRDYFELFQPLHVITTRDAVRAQYVAACQELEDVRPRCTSCDWGLQFTEAVMNASNLYYTGDTGGTNGHMSQAGYDTLSAKIVAELKALLPPWAGTPGLGGRMGMGL